MNRSFAVLQVSAGPPRPGHRLPPALFSPVCNCPTSLARIGFRLRHPNTVTVTIVDKNHHTVATRAKDKLLGAHGPQHFVWDGRTDSGALAPDGVYYPSLHLANLLDRRWRGVFPNNAALVVSLNLCVGPSAVRWLVVPSRVNPI